jgi:hypothetical protein
MLQGKERRMSGRGSFFSQVFGTSKSLSAPSDSRSGPHIPVSDRELAWREAALLWLRWNEAYERVTEAMFAGRNNPSELERLADEADALRREAVVRSRNLLGD